MGKVIERDISFSATNNKRERLIVSSLHDLSKSNENLTEILKILIICIFDYIIHPKLTQI